MLLMWLQVKLFVNKLTSTKTQIPYDYYSLPYCRPKKYGLQSENLGEVLSGDRIEMSVYKVRRLVVQVVTGLGVIRVLRCVV